jgi:hypothetical protein
MSTQKRAGSVPPHRALEEAPQLAGLLFSHFFHIRRAAWNLMAKEHRNAGIAQRVGIETKNSAPQQRN